MQVIKVDQNSEEWFDLRKGKITGSKLKDVITKRAGYGKKMGFYQLIADKLALPADSEDPMERGSRLEDEAAEEFEKRNNVKTEAVGIWVSDVDENIMISPDRVVSDTEAVEIKCLNSAAHIKAIIENTIPKEYEDQAMQYFVVNDMLQKLHFVFYDPRVVAKPYVQVTIDREYFTEEHIKRTLNLQQQLLEEVDEWVEKLAF